eukprot:TRINITY_DN4884_c0_g1_i4.p1 TRINITY_DN4884_c0_g1~~TRINITY_DN4884_c0_g1_i4.p1  ORF type:complete len:640 (-),score=108.32 TRINITY_DN4884_c0_g1_i4:15-1934(-)
MDYLRAKAGDLVERRGDILQKMRNMKDSIVEQTWEVEGRRYTSKKLLAEGGFGFVYLVRDSDTGQPFALKRINVQGRDRLKAVRNEIAVMQGLVHSRHIVRLIGHRVSSASQQETEVLLVLELCSGGSLLDRMNSTIADSNSSVYTPPARPLTEDEILRILHSVCLGVSDMHSHSPPIAHRDIKVENVLLHESGVWKLCDFGSSTTTCYTPTNERERSIANDDISINTTLTYRAPEMVDLYLAQTINEKVDIWALGCLVYKAAFLADPFADGSLAILNCRYNIPEFHKFSPEFMALIKFMLEPDPTARPDIYQVLEKLSGMLKIKYQPPVRQAQRAPQPSTTPQKPSQPPAGPRTTPTKQGAGPAPGVSMPRPSSSGSFFDMLDWQSDTGGRVPSHAPAHAPAHVPAHAPAPALAQASHNDLVSFDPLPAPTVRLNASAPAVVQPATAMHKAQSSNALFDMLEWQGGNGPITPPAARKAFTPDAVHAGRPAPVSAAPSPAFDPFDPFAPGAPAHAPVPHAPATIPSVAHAHVPASPSPLAHSSPVSPHRPVMHTMQPQMHMPMAGQMHMPMMHMQPQMQQQMPMYQGMQYGRPAGYGPGMHQPVPGMQQQMPMPQPLPQLPTYTPSQNIDDFDPFAPKK